MHGRLKVKSTAEQQEAKRKEREKKLKLYNGATSKIFSKRQNGELDEELLHLCGEVLTANPDFYTLWNYRKEVFQALADSKSPQELNNLFMSELYFLESCLKMNPKSYGTWHHRCFVMDSMPEPDWGRELDLCNQFLKYDERNFHCWDYRRFVVKRADVSPEEELEFSMEKISNNFSNYSSWHYRSKLLPLIYPDSAQPMGVSEKALLQEYELVQNGIFTDPDDQSNWFYHRWLMGRGEQQQGINSLHFSKVSQKLTVSFFKPVQIGKNAHIKIKCDGKIMEQVSWCNQDGTKAFSTLWIGQCDGDNSMLTDCDCVLCVNLVVNESEVCSTDLSCKAGDKTSSVRWLPEEGAIRFSQELSAVKTETLQQELESVQQLMDVETDNKWAVLTVVLLMRALDPAKYCNEIMQNLNKLEGLDLKRAEYYRDLRSKFMMEDAIDALDKEMKLQTTPTSCESTLNMAGRGLTKLYHAELLTLVTQADFSDNSLRNLRQFSYFHNLHELRLDHSCLTNCNGLQNLPYLEKLSLKNNSLATPESLTALTKCPSLKEIDLTGNPLLQQGEAVQAVKQLLPGLQVIGS